ncbi:hypothetical protein E3P98_01320 [Wallemia ichthyophaga]|nr:hypothetical protein E3P98_01320 [Wallemia ichthyophaga]
MLIKSLLLAALAGVSVAAVDEGRLAVVKADFNAAGLIGDEFQSEDFNNLQGLLWVKFDNQDEPLSLGQRLSKDAVQEKPEFRYLPSENATLDGQYTLALIDADYNGADQSEGQTRHFLENNISVGGDGDDSGDSDSDNGVAIHDGDSGKVITSYTGPGPARGSGPHRYQFLLLKQPQDFQAPDGLDSQTPLGKMNIADYIDSTNSKIVAATYFICEVGDSTVSAKPTSTVNTASVSATPSSVVAGSGGNNDNDNDNDDNDDNDDNTSAQNTDPDSSSTRAVLSTGLLALVGLAVSSSLKTRLMGTEEIKKSNSDIAISHSDLSRSLSSSRKACDDDYSEYSHSYTQDKGKGRLRSEEDNVVGEEDSRTLCLRHKNMADEGASAELQQALDELPLNQRSAVTSIWSSFSAASSPLRVLILKGILQTCCFSQLSYLYEELGNLIRIDPFMLLPRELNLKIMGYLDAISLARAAQVSRSWKNLADDDLLWRNMCEQHIERKCEKCGWGLPLLEKRRKLQKEPSTKVGSAKRALLASHTAHLAMHDGTGGAPGASATSATPNPFDTIDTINTMDVDDRPVKRHRSARTSPTHSTSISPTLSPSRSASPMNTIRQKASNMTVSPSSSSGVGGTCKPLTRPWKAVYTERLLIERNWRRGTHTVQTLSGHTEGVMCLQFDEHAHPAPTLITGSYDRTARVWNLDTGAQVGVLRGHTRGIRTLKFDEAKLITGSMDRTLKIWNWRNGECIRTLEGHREGVVCLDFDKTVLASGSADATVKVWRFKTAECFTLRGHRDWVNSVQIWDGMVSSSSSISGSEQLREAQKILFSASDDGSIKMWSLGSRECIRSFDSHVGQVQDIKMILVDSKTLEVAQTEHEEGGAPKLQRVLDSSNGVGGSGGNINRGAQGPSASHNTNNLVESSQSSVDKILGDTSASHETVPMLVSGALDNTVKVWDVNTGRCARTLFGHIEGIWSIDADRLRIVSTSHDRTVKVWDTDTGRCLATLVGHAGAVTAVQLSGDKIVTAGDDRDIRIYSFT